MKHIRIASRASKLALVQSNYIRNLLQNLSGNIEISIVEISTKGDRDKSDFLHKSNSIGFFTSEVENAILNGTADIAVHSLKDLPTTPAPGLLIAAIPKREAPADALVTSKPVCSIEDLSAGSTVGTSSLRRITQLKHHRDDLKCVPLRGNVETRVSKVANGSVDAIIVAQAGLNRLGLSDKISAVLPLKQFIPAPAQGALAVQIRADDSELAELLRQIDDEPSRIVVETERAVLASMQGGCSVPIGIYSHITGDSITTNAMISDIQGKRYIERSKTTPLSQSKSSTKKLAEELLSAGGKEILEQIKNSRNNPS